MQFDTTCGHSSGCYRKRDCMRKATLIAPNGNQFCDLHAAAFQAMANAIGGNRISFRKVEDRGKCNPMFVELDEVDL
jgi:predicted glycosyl hydrolase (DUF1957 family)